MNNRFIRTRRRLIKFALLGLIFVGSFTAYFYYIMNMECNADIAYYAIAGKEIASGNLFLKGWYGSTNSFYSLCLIYGILGKIFGYNITLFYVVSALLWAIFVTIISCFTVSLNTNCGIEKYIKVLLVVTICYMSCYFSQHQRLVGGTHLDTAILSMIYVWFLMKEPKENENKYSYICLAISSICLMLALFSDGLPLYFAVLSVILVIFINIFFKTMSKERYYYLIRRLLLTISIAVISKVLMKLISLFGGIQVTWDISGVTLVKREDLFNRLGYFFEEILYLFNANAFGKQMVTANYDIFLHLIFLMILLGLLVVSFSSIRKSLFNQTLIILIGLESLVLILATYIDLSQSVEYTSRIMYYLFISLVLLFGQIDLKKIKYNFDSTIKRHVIEVIAFIGIAVILVLSCTRINSEGKDVINDRIQNVVITLEEKGLTQGYGTFWLSNNTTLLSECKVNVSPVCNAKNLSKYKWLSFDTKRWDFANFVLVDDSNWDSITKETIVESIGVPDEEIQIDNIIILIWEKNIMPYIDGSGSDINLDAWWSLTEHQLSKTIDISNKHFYSSFVADENGHFISDGAGDLLYGPYYPMDAGVYDITFQFKFDESLIEEENIGYVDVFSMSDSIDYQKNEIWRNSKTARLMGVVVHEGCKDAELRSYVNVPGVMIEKVTIEKQK